MPLSPDTTLGVYEVLSAIGAGGMGEVYKARDTNPGRHSLPRHQEWRLGACREPARTHRPYPLGPVDHLRRHRVGVVVVAPTRVADGVPAYVPALRVPSAPPISVTRGTCAHACTIAANSVRHAVGRRPRVRPWPLSRASEAGVAPRRASSRAPRRPRVPRPSRRARRRADGPAAAGHEPAWQPPRRAPHPSPSGRAARVQDWPAPGRAGDGRPRVPGSATRPGPLATPRTGAPPACAAPRRAPALLRAAVSPSARWCSPVRGPRASTLPQRVAAKKPASLDAAG